MLGRFAAGIQSVLHLHHVVLCSYFRHRIDDLRLARGFDALGEMPALATEALNLVALSGLRILPRVKCFSGFYSGQLSVFCGLFICKWCERGRSSQRSAISVQLFSSVAAQGWPGSIMMGFAWTCPLPNPLS